MRKAAIWAEVDATMEVAKKATDLAIEACEDASARTEALELATAELHELRTENMRLRHQARETAAIHDRLAAELVTVQASRIGCSPSACANGRSSTTCGRARRLSRFPGSLRPATMAIRGRSWWRCPGLRGMRCTPSAVSCERGSRKRRLQSVCRARRSHP